MPNSLMPPSQNDLMRQVPLPNQRPVNTVPRGYTPSEWLSELQYGLGRGFGEAQVGALQMATDLVPSLRAGRPQGVYADLWEAAKAIAADPTVLANALRQTGQQFVSGPRGAGQVIGGAVNPRNWLRRRPTIAELDVYHGTPHTFPAEEGAPLGRFRSEKIGTGEGAQAYGYGLYLAEAPQTGMQYKASTSANMYDTSKGIIRSSDLVDELFNSSGKVPKGLESSYRAKANEVVRDLIMGESAKNIAEKLKNSKYGKTYTGLIKAIEDMSPKPTTGNLYKVDLPDAKIEQMLDWDKPLSQQSKKVQDALKRRIVDVQPTDNFDMGGNARLRDNRMGQFDKTKPYPWLLVANSGNGTSAFGLSQKDVDRMFGQKDAADLTGEQILSRVAQQQGGQAQASEYLRSLGIPGIKYLDQGSRGVGQGTRNFVVFPGEEQHLTVLERK